MNFYKIEFEGLPAYYKNLKKLCLANDLKYTTVYYHISKHGKMVTDTLKVEKCIFEN
jgi:hypothetical protein